ncbi:MAG: APC family permease [Acidimicrobiales bacterium]
MPLRRRRAETLGLWDATAMAIGGMVGGGIFTVLGVAVSLGHLAFGCFLIGAVLAALTARSFAVLAKGSGRSGGLFDYLRDAGHPELAALVSWLLCLGYVLALAVYSFTFGHYVADLGGFGPLGADVAAVSVLAVFLAINLRGVALSATSEDLIVAAKLLVLGGVAAIGLTGSTPTGSARSPTRAAAACCWGRPPSSWPTRASSCSRSTTTTSGTRRAPTPAPR